MTRLELVPCSIPEAKAFVERVHRTHRAPLSGKWAHAVARDGEIVAVAIVGRPVARGLQDGWTVEVTRVASDGTINACSMLYGAAWRAARAQGYRRMVTYTGKDEEGTTLRAVGWKVVAEVMPRSWHCESRPRVDKHPIQGRLRWEAPA